MSASLTSLPPPASLVSWHSAGTSHRSKRALSRRQRKQLQIQPHAPGGCLPTVCGAAAFAQSTALGRHRSDDALGVVIVDQGWRTPESDEILLDVAACYGQAYRRERICVASPATLEVAVRGCVEEGANKVMVVPYLLSRSRGTGSTSLPLALADVQLKLPGIRCITGESISVESILAQHIENQVKVVDTKPVDVAERWWTPEPLAAPSQRAERAREDEHPRAAGAPLPAAHRRGWGGSVDATAGRQPGPTPAGPQPTHAAQQAPQHAEQERVLPSSSTTACATPAAAAAAGAAAAACAAEQPAPATTAAGTCRPRAVWSDDMGSLLLSGASVVVVRDCRSKPEAAASATPAVVAAASTAPEASVAQLNSRAAEGGTVEAIAAASKVPAPAQPGLSVAVAATASPSPTAAEADAEPPAAAVQPEGASGPSLSMLAKWAEVAARMAAARVVPLFFLSFWLAGAIWGALFLSWSQLSSSLLLHSLSIPLLMGMLLLLSGGLAATMYVGEQARRRGQAIA